jgi:release factor glutamine methyltransferase
MTSDDQSESQRWTILKTLQWTAHYFKEKGIEQPRPAAEILLAHILDCNRIDLYLRYDQPLHQAELNRFRTLIKRRIKREPVAYITGCREFWSLEFMVTSDVLIPRPETERLVEIVLEQYPAKTRMDVLDLGVGSGAISVALAVERPAWRIRAADLSPEALAVAQHNAKSNGCADSIRFFAGNWFEPISVKHGVFDLIVSNPPYIPSDVLLTLEPEVHQFEPVIALDGGKQGTTCLGHLIHTAPSYLKPGGTLFLEIGYDQRAAVEDLGKASGAYEKILVYKDYGRRDRVARLTRR